MLAHKTLEKVVNWPPKQWYVTFKVKMGPPNAGWTNLFYFSDHASSLGKFLPTFLLSPGNHLRCITLIGVVRDYSVYNVYLQQVFTEITMEQQIKSGKYYVYTYVNGTRTSSKIHHGYRSFPLVSVRAMFSEKGATIKDFDYGEIV
jgi:hypothetical protein